MKGRHQVGAITSSREVPIQLECSVSVHQESTSPNADLQTKEDERGAQGQSSSRNYLPLQLQWVDGQRRLRHFISVSLRPRSKCCYCWMGTCHIRRTWKRSSRPCESGVIMLSLQPHKAHRLHPVDVSFFKPLQTYYDQEGEKWLRSHAGRGITRGITRDITTYHISELLGAAYLRAATMANAVNGFRKCSICRSDRLAFDDELQLISSTTPAPSMCPTSSVSLAPDPVTQGTGSAYSAAASVGGPLLFGGCTHVVDKQCYRNQRALRRQ